MSGDDREGMWQQFRYSAELASDVVAIGTTSNERRTLQLSKFLGFAFRNLSKAVICPSSHVLCFLSVYFLLRAHTRRGIITIIIESCR